MFVEIPWETVSAKLGEAYKDLGKGVALKGFRKGKVPRPVLEQVYGQRVNAEVAYQLVRESFFRASEEHKLAAVAEPRVEEAAPIKKGQPFTFAAIIEIRGEVVPQDYKGLAIERRKLDVKDEAVEEALAQLRREHTELRPIEGRDVTAPGDIVGLSVTGTIGEHQINQPQFAVDLDDAEREPLPGMREALLGIPLDTKDKQLELDGPRRPQGRVDPRAQGQPDADGPRGARQGRARARRRVRQGHRQGGDARRAARGAAQGARGQGARGDRPRGARGRAARADQEEPDPGRVVAGRARGRDAVPAPAPDARHEARARQSRACRARCARRCGPPAPTRSAVSSCSRRSPTRRASRSPTPSSPPTSRRPRRRATRRPPSSRAEWQRDGRIDNVTYSLRQDKVLKFLVEQASVTEVEKLTPGRHAAARGRSGDRRRPRGARPRPRLRSRSLVTSARA